MARRFAGTASRDPLRLYRRLAVLGATLADGLAGAARAAGVPLQVNAFGSMLTPFFTSEAVRDYRSALTASPARYGRFFRGMLVRGIYLPPSQFEAWFISLAHTTADLEKTAEAAREVLAGPAR